MKFEYKTKSYRPKGFWLGGKVDDDELNKILNDTAKDNWVLDQMQSVQMSYGATSKIILIFKRPMH